MIVVKGKQTTLEGDTRSLMAESARILYALISAQANASGKPFEETAEWMITFITTTVLETNRVISDDS